MFCRYLGLMILPVLLIAGLLLTSLKHPPPTLTVVSWAGPYAHAQMSAQITPFSRKTGANLRLALYDGGTSEIARQVVTHTVTWDVVDMEMPDAVAACRARLLEPLAQVGATPGISQAGAPAITDFLPGALGPCWAGEVTYARVIAYDPHRFATSPHRLADFFDTIHFPGKRLISGSAKYNMEMALQADGVPPAEIYSKLSTASGRRQAFAKLDSLKGELIFAGPQDNPIQMLNHGEIAFATVLNGDIADAAAQGLSTGVIWQGQMTGYDVLVMVRGTPHKKLAADYIRAATSAPTLGALASWLPYGPARKSALSQVGNNPALQASLQPYQPTSGTRLSTALAIDETWWAKHGGEVSNDWQNWRNHKG